MYIYYIIIEFNNQKVQVQDMNYIEINLIKTKFIIYIKNKKND